MSRLPGSKWKSQRFSSKEMGDWLPEKLEHVFELFRRKYGEDQIEKWYDASRSKRKPVEIVLGRVLGKKPSSRNSLIEITI